MFGAASFSLLGALQSGVLDPQGPIGVQQRTMLLNATSIMLAVIIPVIVLTPVFAWWFRASNTKARYLPRLGIPRAGWNSSSGRYRP